MPCPTPRVTRINECMVSTSRSHSLLEAISFFTITGPRAIDLAAAREENPNIAVGQLLVGDILYRLNPQGPSQYLRLPIESITMEPTPGETIYGVHLSHGSHGGSRYHTNGSKLSQVESTKICKQIRSAFSCRPEGNIARGEHHTLTFPLKIIKGRQDIGSRQIHSFPESLASQFSQSTMCSNLHLTTVAPPYFSS